MSVFDSKTFNFRSLNIEDLNLNYIASQKSRDPMTTVVGIKSNDGIVLASDSQATGELIKDIGMSKIFRINASMGIGVSGIVGHIKILQQMFKQEFKSAQFETELDVRQNAEKILCELFRKYNVERSDRLGFKTTQYLFDGSAILCTKLNDGVFVLHKLTLIPQPWVELVEDYDYEAIGSGEIYAKLLIRQQNRAPQYGLSGTPTYYNAWVAMLAISEIKTIDSKSGGLTQVAILDKSGFRILTEHESREIYCVTREKIATKLVEVMNISMERALALYPNESCPEVNTPSFRSNVPIS